jgi:hypothetical protein
VVKKIKHCISIFKREGAKDAEFRGVLFTTEEQRMHKLRLATDAQMDFFKGFVL